MSGGDLSAPNGTVVIVAKRVDAAESTETVREVAVPATELGRRYQLADLVRELYPDAEFRSFADDVASFLAPKLLIVARYRSRPRTEDPDVGARAQMRIFEG